MNISGNVRPASLPISGGVERAKTVYVKELAFRSYKEFPAVGNSAMLYIATDEGAIYRFDDETNTYACIGRDYTEIEAIQCKLKEEN